MASQFEIDTVRRIAALEGRLARQGAPGGFAQASAGGDLLDPFLNLPALRGLWSAGSVSEAGALQDRSNQGRHLAVKQGAPRTFIERATLPYMFYGGGGAHSRADEPGLNAAANNVFLDPTLQGLTVGGWFRLDGLVGRPVVMSKDLASSRGWVLYSDDQNAGVLTFEAYGSNAGGVTARSANGVSAAVWHFMVGQWAPGGEVVTYLDGARTASPGASAALQPSSADFTVAASSSGGSNRIIGSMGACFMLGMRVPVETLDYLYKRTRGFFGV